MAAMLFLALFGLTAANAALLRCASHSLARAQRDAVLHDALHLVPHDGGVLTLESACWNTDFAIAWLRTPTVVGPDGVYSWWAVHCRRKARSWSCDPAELVRRVEVPIAGRSRRYIVVGSLPQGMSPSRARAIIATTVKLAMRLKMPLPACSKDNADANGWHSAHGNPSAPNVEYPAAEVDFADMGINVDYQSLRFHFDNDGQAVCWYALVVVD